ncbi:unnamed protein product [Phaedon cochleariae]|uniref:Lipase domain-containing protein n=1 Tax=Phaedon cochleariae TaxID=80249 RepID=A0A9N9SI83_PHACE|nr:unnamed protein product [Phaedon cochleariae]
MVAVDKNTSVIIQTMVFMMNQSIIQKEDYYNKYSPHQDSNVKCYGTYGCFDVGPPWTSDTRPVALFPEDIKKIEPKFHLYTRKNPLRPGFLDVSEMEFFDEESSFLDPKKPIYLITHGYVESGYRDWIGWMARALLAREDCNVIVIDWEGGSEPPYGQAVANIRLVGAIAAHLLAEIAQYTGGLKLDHVHAIGHSLGAHLFGYTGYTLQKEFNLTLGRITGMDPAEPHFSNTVAPVRLDRSAAQYVDVIHTDARGFISGAGGLGIIEPIGHVDYYPNGGRDQPGCTKGISQFIRDNNNSIFDGFRRYVSCNHLRSHQIFLDSLKKDSRCKYLTVTCTSFKDFMEGQCFDCGKNRANCIPFGFDGRKHYEKFSKHKYQHKSRTQYLLTGANAPYCRSHYRISVEISDSNFSKTEGGEVGTLHFTMHSSEDGKGDKTGRVGFFTGYHRPGGGYTGVVATDGVTHMGAIEVEWKYETNLLNPLTYRILTSPRIYLRKVTVEALDIDERITVCPKGQKPVVNGLPQLMLPSYC